MKTVRLQELLREYYKTAQYYSMGTSNRPIKYSPPPDDALFYLLDTYSCYAIDDLYSCYAFVFGRGVKEASTTRTFIPCWWFPGCR
jgi:hypothetical protein